MANFKLEVCRASCSPSTGYGTVTADQRTHLDEQTLASRGYVDIVIKWKDGKGQDLECWLTTMVITMTV